MYMTLTYLVGSNELNHCKQENTNKLRYLSRLFLSIELLDICQKMLQIAHKIVLS
jgi:hypothetical protein